MKNHLLEWSGGVDRDPRIETVADGRRNFAELISPRYDLVHIVASRVLACVRLGRAR